MPSQRTWRGYLREIAGPAPSLSRIVSSREFYLRFTSTLLPDVSMIIPGSLAFIDRLMPYLRYLTAGHVCRSYCKQYPVCIALLTRSTLSTIDPHLGSANHRRHWRHLEVRLDFPVPHFRGHLEQ